MEKIKIDLTQKQEFITEKILGKKTQIKTVININDILSINDICQKQFIATGVDTFKVYPIIKGIFDLLVIHYNTNIEVDCIKNENIIDNETVVFFANSNIINKISTHIENYSEAWALVQENLRLLNVCNSLKIISETFPTTEAINNSVKDIADTIKNNKEIFNSVVENAEINSIVMQSKDEMQKSKSKKIKTQK